jgi:CBS domain containing-hemolysin-like protein
LTRETIILLLSILSISFVKDAYAYIDPNTGGFFFQTVAPFVYGILGAIVIFWKRIVNFIKGLFHKKKNGDGSTGNE